VDAVNARALDLREDFLCLITPLCSYLYGGLYGGLYERAHIIRCYPPLDLREGQRRAEVDAVVLELRDELPALAASKLSGRPKRRELARAILREHSRLCYRRLELA
jgi:hypothetical protein